jgi:lysophospholipase L1-like esterase
LKKSSFVIAALAFMLIACAIALTLLFVRFQEVRDGHASSRSKAILSHASQEQWDVVIIGDSMVELASINQICGKKVLNAGISGATVRGMSAISEQLAKMIKPRIAIIALGTNNSRVNQSGEDASFDRDYLQIIKNFRAVGSEVKLMEIPPTTQIEKGVLFDKMIVQKRNNFINKQGLPVGHIWKDLVTPAGWMNLKYTTDGVHPNNRGYALWLASIGKLICA